MYIASKAKHCLNIFREQKMKLRFITKFALSKINLQQIMIQLAIKLTTRHGKCTDTRGQQRKQGPSNTTINHLHPPLNYCILTFFSFKVYVVLIILYLITILYTCLMLTTRTHGLVTDGNAKLCCRGSLF